MRNVNTPSGEFEHLGFSMKDHPTDLLQVIQHPHIMVSGKKVDADAPGRELSQLIQHAIISTRYTILVFEPKVEDVAGQHDRLRIAGRPVEPLHETALPAGRARLVARPQVNIRRKIVHQRVSSASLSSRLLP